MAAPSSCKIISMVSPERYLGSAGPSMTVEPPAPLPYVLGPADYPECPYTAQMREALFSRGDYAYAQSMEYASMVPPAMTWDYASNFLYAKPARGPYPYVLQRGE